MTLPLGIYYLSPWIQQCSFVTMLCALKFIAVPWIPTPVGSLPSSSGWRLHLDTVTQKTVFSRVATESVLLWNYGLSWWAVHSFRLLKWKRKDASEPRGRHKSKFRINRQTCLVKWFGMQGIKSRLGVVKINNSAVSKFVTLSDTKGQIKFLLLQHISKSFRGKEHSRSILKTWSRCGLPEKKYITSYKLPGIKVWTLKSNAFSDAGTKPEYTFLGLHSAFLTLKQMHLILPSRWNWTNPERCHWNRSKSF